MGTLMYVCLNGLERKLLFLKLKFHLFLILIQRRKLKKFWNGVRHILHLFLLRQHLFGLQKV